MKTIVQFESGSLGNLLTQVLIFFILLVFHVCATLGLKLKKKKIHFFHLNA